ncbi:MAG: tetratricopeptide repeat protein [Candidatus Eisenbacteria bacterium]|nr:tetratricopeptide repeat protein [Candidatus Eisenbacteria bacterium]
MVRTARNLAIWILLAIPALAAAVDFDAIETLTSPAQKVDAYEALLGVDADSAEILFKLGNAYYDMQLHDEAIERYRRSLRAAADLPVLVNLTYVLAELNRREEADKAFRDFLAARPLDPLARAFYADFLAESGEIAAEPEERQKETQRAAEEYRRALEIDPRCVEARFGFGVLFARAGIFEEAIREWKRALETDPRHRLASRLRVNISDAERRLGR